MSIDHKLELGIAISAIEAIAIMLPSVGKRSELSVIQQEMYKLITEARKHAEAMEKELVSLQYEYPSDRNKAPRRKQRGINRALTIRWLSTSLRPKGRGIKPAEIQKGKGSKAG